MKRERRWILTWLGVAVAGLLAMGGRGMAAEPATPPAVAAPGEIDRLIRQLGAESFASREQASQRLTRLDDQALPALRSAKKDPDPEIRSRAVTIYRAITELSPERQPAIVAAAAKAFAEADYPSAARQQTLLARRSRPTFDECIAVGHDWQLAGNWSAAVRGYERALERVEEVLGGDPETDPPPPREFPGLAGDAPPGPTDLRRQELASLRAGLILFVGRIQRDELADPAAAVVTFSRIVDAVPEFKGDLHGFLTTIVTEMPRHRQRGPLNMDRIGRGLLLLNEFNILEQLARTQESLGRIDDTILTLARLNKARLQTREDEVDESLARMTRLMQKSPAVGKLPIAATLIALVPPASPASAVPRKTLQVQVFPTGGKLTLDGKPLAGSVAVDDLAPGVHQVQYEPPGSKPAVRVQAAFKPGIDYGLFLNPESPFTWTLTNLGDFKLGSCAVRDRARLPDGRWIAAISTNSRIYTATTRDLITWDAPRPLPHNGINNNLEPALMVDGGGVIWIAWFSNRLSLTPQGSGGFQLWLTRSTDAQTWSAPRAIATNHDGWPMGSLHWLRCPDGRFRLSWRLASATAASPAQISQLDPMQNLATDQLWPLDPQLAVDDAGQYHRVFTDVFHGITYARSGDGTQWSDPALLVQRRGSETVGKPQLLIDGKRVALIYEEGLIDYLRRGTLADLPRLSPPVPIGRIDISTVETRWQRSGDEVFGFVSGEAPWLLRAKVQDLFKEP